MRYVNDSECDNQLAIVLAFIVGVFVLGSVIGSVIVSSKPTVECTCPVSK